MMKDGGVKLVVGLLMFILMLSILSGCGFRRNPSEIGGLLRVKDPNALPGVSIKEFVTVKDPYCCVKPFHDDRKYDTQVVSAFDNTVVYAMGSGKVVHPPTGLVYVDHLIIYDITMNRIVKKISADPGFVQFWDTGINKNWIIWDEVDTEFNQTVKGYAMNRRTGKIKLIFSVNKNGGENSFWFGTKDKTKLKNLTFDLNETILTGNNVYIGYNLGTKTPFSVLKSAIVSINLNDLKKSVPVNIKVSNAGLSRFSVNENYIAFSIFGRNKQNMFSDIYLYSFKSGKIVKFTDNNISCAPSLAPDNYIVFVLRSKESMEIPPKGYDDTEYLAIALVDNPDRVKIITKSSKTDHIAISSKGRFVLLDDYENGWFVYDRKEDYLLLIKGSLLPTRPSFASDNIIVGLHQKNGGFSVLNLSLLYKMLKLAN